MEDWQKEWQNLCESFTTGVEEFFQEVEEELGEWVSEMAEITIEIAETLDNLLFRDLEASLNEWLEPIEDSPLESREEEPYYNPFGDLEQFPINPEHQACVGCCHYHGQVYGGNLLVCGMHPYGPEDASCRDWAGMDGS
ncbi:hypothetical protein [Roseofilum sp. Belize Diploria]|uniref:hypothetical protein n=1 Tax=Roseofilum sp. Belize Diploria TaxID=2821501 RepID=UPI000E9A50F1|nr:hypothetical protein [Roseofilum sp. Belize Diploria]MBP0009169.1 hypothetical protein [Roseofilum sp. Belize Diploria]HBR00721.1 hypothetical protein [Cyanobacteria bacterium UBA11691]